MDERQRAADIVRRYRDKLDNIVTPRAQTAVADKIRLRIIASLDGIIDEIVNGRPSGWRPKGMTEEEYSLEEIERAQKLIDEQNRNPFM